MIRIADLEIEKDKLPNKQYKKVKKWVSEHQSTLGDIFKQLNPDL